MSFIALKWLTDFVYFGT